ncbi:MAG: hypothetical protein IID35_11080, partial [Planctomycetes bacterium]|nr:hypothetical protein [Planctomycetota bacterium]
MKTAWFLSRQNILMNHRRPRNAWASSGVASLFAILLFMPASSFAQLPINDSCDVAEPIEIGATVEATTDGATVDRLPTCGFSGVSAGLWFSVIGDGSRLNAVVCASFGPAVVSVYCRGCDDLGCTDTTVERSDTSCDGKLVSWCSDVGVEYLLHVQGLRSSGPGSFELTISSTLASCPRGSSCLSAPTPPVNDGCENPIVIVGSGDNPFSLHGASVDGELYGCAASKANEKDVWFQWTSTLDDWVQFSVCGATSFPVNVEAYECDCRAPNDMAPDECFVLSPTECNSSFLDDSVFQAVQDECYLLRVIGADGGGDGVLSIRYGEPEPLPCSIVGSGQTLNPCTSRSGWDGISSTRPNEIVATRFTLSAEANVGRLCFWGTYYNGTPGDCRPPYPDEFEVTFYTDDCGKPGEVIGGPSRQNNGTLFVHGPVATGGTLAGGLLEYEYFVEFSGVALDADTDYWLEISNYQAFDCSWYWSRADSRSEAIAIDGLRGEGPDGFDHDEVVNGTMSYCMRAELVSDAPHCLTPPANDNLNAAETINIGETPFSTFGAAVSEGASTRYPEPCVFTLGDPLIDTDIWYRFDATCHATVLVETCGASFDTKLAAYPNGLSDPDEHNVIACNDDECGDPNFPLQAALTFPAREGESFL